MPTKSPVKGLLFPMYTTDFGVISPINLHYMSNLKVQVYIQVCRHSAESAEVMSKSNIVQLVMCAICCMCWLV